MTYVLTGANSKSSKLQTKEEVKIIITAGTPIPKINFLDQKSQKRKTQAKDEKQKCAS
jgi:signal recognition particle receptor subunit beta